LRAAWWRRCEKLDSPERPTAANFLRHVVTQYSYHVQRVDEGLLFSKLSRIAIRIRCPQLPEAFSKHTFDWLRFFSRPDRVRFKNGQVEGFLPLGKF